MGSTSRSHRLSGLVDNQARVMPRSISLCCALWFFAVIVIDNVGHGRGAGAADNLEPATSIARQREDGEVQLGKLLFHDPRLSGDATISCASCHDPAKAWTDGQPLAKGYPGSLYFRNTPTLMNVGQARYVYWDGRLPADDLATVVRDHISEAHFMQADGRLVIERLRQVPSYEARFHGVYGGEPTYGRILNAVAAYLRTLETHDAPLQRYLQGDKAALTAGAERGMALFVGRAGCVGCHNGPHLTDQRFHNLGLPPNRDIFASPLRHVSLRRFFRTLGVSHYARLRADIGRSAITKQTEDEGRFRTPSLWEAGRTAPYMHDGSLPTLEHVIEFYDEGGGHSSDQAALAPLRLTASEKADLVEFLHALSSPPEPPAKPKLPDYELRTLGDN